MQGREGPRYLAIADAIAGDVAAGRLAPGDRLPPQRTLAGRLSLDFTTVARGYVEAGKRGLVESIVGRGTFVRRAAMVRGEPAPSRSRADFSMNMPPEPDDPELLARMRDGFASVAADLETLLRYQGFGGSPTDRDAAAAGSDGARSSLRRSAYSSRPARMARWSGSSACSPRPATWSCARRSPIPASVRSARSSGCSWSASRRTATASSPRRWRKPCEAHAPKAIYLNPTLQNPTTITIPERRRAAICSIARRHDVPIVEDDAYGFIPTHGPRAARGDRAGRLLAHCRPRQMHRRRPAARLCGRPGRARRLVVQQRDARALA